MTAVRRGFAKRQIHLKRVYEPPAKEDGERILVERLWPRGLSRRNAKVDVWLKDIAPSTGLRQWFGHDPVKWAEFRRRYEAELKAKRDVVARLVAKVKTGPVTLVFAARDERHNGALVLKRILDKIARRK